MAKKRVQQARRNLDLRRRLNYLRSVKRKVDLRFKLIANMIATFKTRPRNFHQRQRPVLYQYQPQYHNSGGTSRYLFYNYSQWLNLFTA